MAGGRIREVAGWLAASLIAVITVGQVAASARADLLFRDGDSLVVAMLVRSMGDGEALDWAMSSVLFLPEIAVFGLLWAVGRMLSLGVDAVLALGAVLNLVALYGAIRLVAGRRRAGRSPVAWSLLALGAFAALAVTETSASRDALELASLHLTTTYYSATVVAVVASVGVVRRALDRSGAGDGLRGAPIVLGVVAAVSTLSNPLFAAWATVPLGLLLAVAATRATMRRPVLPLLVWLAGGTVLGLLGRLPFGSWIANSGAGYAQPGLWPQSVRYYGLLLGERVSPLGVIAMLGVAALLVLAVRRTVRAPDAGSRLVAAAAWVLPLLVAVGAIGLGTHAARYLQPLAFAPILALVAHPAAVRMPRPAARVIASAAVAVLVAGAAVSVPRIAATTERPDADLACVTDWIAQSGRIGAGQFWTARLVKLHLADPAQLVQVDHRLRSYAWLVNRADFAAGEVTFLIEDAQTVAWELPVSATPSEVVECGRYTILDFARGALPLGPEHS